MKKKCLKKNGLKKRWEKKSKKLEKKWGEKSKQAVVEGASELLFGLAEEVASELLFGLPVKCLEIQLF